MTMTMTERKLGQGFCEAELSAVVDCVKGDPACTECYRSDGIAESFEGTAENLFRTALAFRTPQDPRFCVEANWRICTKAFRTVEQGGGGEKVSDK